MTKAQKYAAMAFASALIAATFGRFGEQGYAIVFGMTAFFSMMAAAWAMDYRD